MSKPRFGAMPEGVEEKEIDVNGITSTYWEIGEGEPLVFTHGAGPGTDGIGNWCLVLPLFAKAGFRAIAVNALGFGAGDYRPGGENVYPEPGFRYDMHSRIQHQIGYLDALGIDQACLVGNSMGGAISVGVAGVAPERVRRMVLMGPGGLPIHMRSLANAVAAYDKPDREVMRQIVTALSSEYPVPNMEEHIEYRYQLTALETNTIARHAINEAARDPETGEVVFNRVHQLEESDIAKVRTETLLIYGREDQATTLDLAMRYHRLLENSWLTSIPHCGHWAMMRYPEAFTELCTWFLRSDSPWKAAS